MASVVSYNENTHSAVRRRDVAHNQSSRQRIVENYEQKEYSELEKIRNKRLQRIKNYEKCKDLFFNITVIVLVAAFVLALFTIAAFWWAVFGGYVNQLFTRSYFKEEGGYQVAAWKEVGKHKIKHVSGEMRIPAHPRQNINACIYYWIGLCDMKKNEKYTDVFQAVIGYGNNGIWGGHYWSVACWFVDEDNTMYSKYVQVDPLEKIYANFSLEDEDTWKCEIITERGETTTLTVPRHLANVPDTVAVALEIYDIQRCSELPVSGGDGNGYLAVENVKITFFDDVAADQIVTGKGFLGDTPRSKWSTSSTTIPYCNSSISWTESERVKIEWNSTQEHLLL